MTLLRLFLRSRKAPVLALFVPVYLLLLYFGPTGLNEVPFRPAVQTILIVVLALLPAALLSQHFASPMATLEYMCTPTTLIRLKTFWYFGLTAATILLITLVRLLRPADSLGDGIPDDTFLMLIRNTFLAVAIACFGSRLLPPAYSWAPGAIFMLVVWQFGTVGYAGEYATWALPNYVPQSVLSWITILGFWAVMGVEYLRPKLRG